MYKSMRKDQGGFTFIEFVIVIGIMSIMLTAAVNMIGYLNYANTKKTVQRINTALDNQQVKAMTKANTSYLYIYHLDDGYYIKQINKTPTEVKADIAGNLDDEGDKISNNNIEIYKDTDTGIKVEDNTFISVGYTKTGIYNIDQTDRDNKTNVDAIVIKGKSIHKIRLVALTGKHIVE